MKTLDMAKVLDDIDDMAAEAQAKWVEEERLFGPFLDTTDTKKYVRGSLEWAAAEAQMRRRRSAMAAHARGDAWEDVQAILNPDMSQVVTARAWGEQRRSKSDRERAHLRRELTKAVRRAKKMDDESLVCKQWVEDIQSLYDYAGPMPEGDLTYRFCTVDTAGPFAPGNTKWQSHDDLLVRLSIRTVEFEGEEITLAELAKRTKLSVGTLRSRYDAGVRGPDLWTGRNLGAVYSVDVAGTKMTLAEAARAWGINPNTLRARLQRGLKGNDLFAKTDARTGSTTKPTRGLRSTIKVKE